MRGSGNGITAYRTLCAAPGVLLGSGDGVLLAVGFGDVYRVGEVR